jgi:hypothetical protein
MADTPNALASETGLSSELVHSGLGAILDFLKQHLGPEMFDRIQQVIPNATDFLKRFESAPDASGSGGGGSMAAVAGLASKLFGSGGGDVAKLFESFDKLGFTSEQIETFLPKAFEFLKAHLPADLVEQVLAKLPALAKFAEAKAE